MYKVSMVSLGCPKNQVDAEMMLKLLSDAGLEICSAEAEADAIIINTCGFIEAAKAEAIENILEAAEYKKDGNTCKIWLEDLDSLHERMKVIAGADVAGVAAWRLGQEIKEAWSVIGDYMKQE